MDQFSTAGQYLYVYLENRRHTTFRHSGRVSSLNIAIRGPHTSLHGRNKTITGSWRCSEDPNRRPSVFTSSLQQRVDWGIIRYPGSP